MLLVNVLSSFLTSWATGDPKWAHDFASLSKKKPQNFTHLKIYQQSFFGTVWNPLINSLPTSTSQHVPDFLSYLLWGDLCIPLPELVISLICPGNQGSWGAATGRKGHHHHCWFSTFYSPLFYPYQLSAFPVSSFTPHSTFHHPFYLSPFVLCFSTFFPRKLLNSFSFLLLRTIFVSFKIHSLFL